MKKLFDQQEIMKKNSKDKLNQKPFNLIIKIREENFGYQLNKNLVLEANR